MKATVITVTTSATALPTTALNSRTSMEVYNDGTETVYLGDQNVAATGSTKGIPLKPGAYKTFGCSEKFKLYGISANANVDVIVGEAY